MPREATLKAKLNHHIQENISIYTFTIVLFLMGIIFGAIIVNSLPDEAKSNLFNYLERFFGEVSGNNVAVPSVMFNEGFTHYIQYIGFIWILGLSIIGLPIIFVLLFLKGIVIGFTVGFLVNQMGMHGFWLAIASIFPQNLLVIPLFIIVSTTSIAFSLKMIRQLLMRTRKQPLLPQFGQYVLMMFGMAVVIALVSLYEAYVSPVLMRAILN
ncbi:stage II sporulation protein M [Pullulanibacillus pueri]|uniref:Stage II sporulation protein M n=1 Tax=Pullulanibacillus pueri TaxID=1437324 RepID=A0A8J2ZUC2_9BACL|nr:stage II sporulation protein M [Pullulanibacillus pueri]MBM7681662.1 stage II sporulation protein M [Pullulanibacillus pueri]GGH79262.1 stage II sporulation protein M [Pullulanibacillus pueri]